MAEALREAARASGRTHPNPLVGCVLVRDGEIVSRGYHRRAGTAHAEVAALQALDGSAEGCDAYINLEPCCHVGRTGPCTGALIEAGIARVFVGTLDPDPRVSGQGVEILRKAGIEVFCGVLEAESRRLNRAYFKRITTGFPWVTVKYAMTLDGKIASKTGDSAWISSEASRERVHQLRDTHDAILVGTKTLIHDNPRLNCRVEGGRDPLRVVLDTRLEAPLESTVFDPDYSSATTLVAVGPGAPGAKREALEARGVEVVEVAVDANGHLEFSELFAELSRRGIMSILIEGGSQVLGSLFDQQWVDEVYAFVCPKIVGGAQAHTAVAGEGVSGMRDAMALESLEIEVIDGHDVLIRGEVPADKRAHVGT
ncbi:bifunctional diaminohydroxyphosphoribosylaminopyrimidine deaminase/5-amino-6-(5-phosphoribosylamino)uracil reductase RibD [Bradymonas sediminis]|uniref:Riboflavin biosynthesis protein RibD n=2 Tax=Bradymonas sediminis TaxID=1548548 RepID=A0A2Z4FQW1_9DELT|nr:bifunctional diaminohydroxyphosphoribosylaminopyrimidine deaminase/5-amino-6-(5-phosphoribosylamino)uracil reductase RibD [Bradymonas sediminis]